MDFIIPLICDIFNNLKVKGFFLLLSSIESNVEITTKKLFATVKKIGS